MERSFKSVLDYIRGFFSIPPLERGQKRKASVPTFDLPPRSKISRFSPYTTKSPVRIIPIERETDDSSPWYHKSEGLKRSLHQSNYRIPMKQPKLKETIVIDDDEVDKPNMSRQESRAKSKAFTSTPADKTFSFVNRNGIENGGDDVILVKCTKSPKEKQMEARMAGFEYIKPKTNSGISASQKSSRSKLRNLRSPINGSFGSSLDYSYRLEDKMQYKKLLEQANNTDSSFYETPVGKIFNSYNITNSNEKKGKSSLFDGNKSHEKPKTSTKDAIIMVLDNLENDAVVVKDSDSEGSLILVSPPSPKPDIKVDPVNSFKKVVDTSKVTKKDWLNEIVENHKHYVEERQREIDSLRQYSQKTEEINKDINIEILKRKVNDCLHLKEVILPEPLPLDELPELTEEQLAMVQRAFRGDPNEVLARKFNLNVTRRDLMTLAGLNWINDEVINFYMNLINERGKDPAFPSTYCFNTFFYLKLLRDGPQSLKRWTKKVDLFSHDLICVPIHLGMHWCMAIIDFRDKSIRYYDSMGSPNNRCLEALRHYLEVEYMDKKNSSYDTDEFILENVADIPQQMNGSDCGIFSCTFAEFISRNGKITFTQDDMPYMRKKMVVEIMTGELLIK